VAGDLHCSDQRGRRGAAGWFGRGIAYSAGSLSISARGSSMTAGLRGRQRTDRPAGDDDAVPACCPYYHEAIELIGRRWSGAIVEVLLQRSAMRFSEIAQAVPQISDRLLSERMKELETRGLVSREVHPGPPV